MKRSGFTLIEMVLVLLIMGIVFAMVVPSLDSIGGDPEEGQPWKEVADLLRSSRNVALEHAVTVKLVLDPNTGRYRVDSTGARGAGIVWEGELALGIAVALEADSARARFSFRPDGSAFADSLIVRGGGSATWMSLDPFSGEVLFAER